MIVSAEIIQADVAWKELQKDSHLGPVVLNCGKCPLLPSKDYFRELCESILAQQISGKVALVFSKRLNDVLDGKVDPITVFSLSVEEIRRLGISVRKAESLLDLAKHCLEGQIQLEKLRKMPEMEIREGLTHVKGIGPWTVTMFLIFALNRSRVIPSHDFGIRKAIQKLYGLAEMPKIAEVPQYFLSWAPHESVASWYLWRSLENDGRV